ncbi:glycoside hydrolase family 43 protein [Fulvivirgaceae bacterium BMA10]|uniref:Glycoside hydrolase family 43 protein n=1 Tax=Splendidivirga corallicola TaxID=3051826 RepID=A0ABT8KN49_9BACT|nr:glycoside hydrolase family 43 protein [Fulvivirgaceae bacterium BMA10]
MKLLKLTMYLIIAGTVNLQCTSEQKTGNREDTNDREPSDAKEKLLTTNDIRIRDPFVLADSVTGKYYMYAQMDNRLGGRGNPNKPKGVEVYVSSDLEHWEYPETVLLLPEDFWGRNMVWAPEVHAHNGQYYLFATITSYDTLSHLKRPEGVTEWPSFFKRGTQIFVADSPMGPFKWFSNESHTPTDWMALDGTLWEEDGKPYMIFCHEWVEIIDGTMDYVELKKDLSGTIGAPELMFKASDAPWVGERSSYVTDGCYLYRTKDGVLLMIWSSFGAEGYAIGIVESESGKLRGPWKHQDKLLFHKNGGHGMIFRNFNNQLIMTLHQPNSPRGEERAKFFKLEDSGNTLNLLEIN